MEFKVPQSAGDGPPPYWNPNNQPYALPGLHNNSVFYATLKFVLLFVKKDLQKSCIDFITIRPDDEPNLDDVIEVLEVVQKGCAPLHVMAAKYNSLPNRNFDFHRLIVFAQLHGLIKCLEAN